VNVLLIAVGIAGFVLLILAVAYCWRHRPLRSPGDEWRDEAAMQAGKFVNRSGTGG